jgi:hypothetical protein
LNEIIIITYTELEEFEDTKGVTIVKPHATNRLYPRTSTFLTDVISENAGIGNRF